MGTQARDGKHWAQVHAAWNQSIPSDKTIDLSNIFAPEDRRELEEVFEVFGQYSPWSLRNGTYAEVPWKNTQRNQAIDRALMRDYFAANYL